VCERDAVAVDDVLTENDERVAGVVELLRLDLEGAVPLGQRSEEAEDLVLAGERAAPTVNRWNGPGHRVREASLYVVDVQGGE
jgi:hypothetical protein